MHKHSEKKSRRGLLKILGLGGVATASLPVRWSKPVVDSVLLPVHAQTSATEPSDCRTSVQVPGCTITCSDGESEEFAIYTVDVMDGCLVVEQVPPFPSGISRFGLTCSNAGNFLDAGIIGNDADNTQTSPALEFVDQNCAEGCTEIAPFETILPFSDIPAQVAFTLSRTCGDDPTLTISNIEVSLV